MHMKQNKAITKKEPPKRATELYARDVTAECDKPPLTEAQQYQADLLTEAAFTLNCAVLDLCKAIGLPALPPDVVARRLDLTPEEFAPFQKIAHRLQTWDVTASLGQLVVGLPPIVRLVTTDIPIRTRHATRQEPLAATLRMISRSVFQNYCDYDRRLAEKDAEILALRKKLEKEATSPLVSIPPLHLNGSSPTTSSS